MSAARLGHTVGSELLVSMIEGVSFFLSLLALTFIE